MSPTSDDNPDIQVTCLRCGALCHWEVQRACQRIEIVASCRCAPGRQVIPVDARVISAVFCSPVQPTGQENTNGQAHDKSP